MHALARGAARASGLCHHLSVFDAWEIVYLVLHSPEGERLRAISMLGHQSHPTAKPAAQIAVQSSRDLTWAKFDVSVLRNGLAVSYCRFVGYTEVTCPIPAIRSPVPSSRFTAYPIRRDTPSAAPPLPGAHGSKISRRYANKITDLEQSVDSTGHPGLNYN
jgi:hypothetical protein